LVVVVASGALGFFGGIKYRQSQRLRTANIQIGANRPGLSRSGDARQIFRPVIGEITALDDSTITVKSADGSSSIITYSASTAVNKTQSASVTDLKVGDTISVTGTRETNATVTAQTIYLGGMFPGFPKPTGLP